MLSSILNLVPRNEVLSYYSTPIDRNIHTSIQKYEKVYMGHMLTVEWKNIPLKDKNVSYCGTNVTRILEFQWWAKVWVYYFAQMRILMKSFFSGMNICILKKIYAWYISYLILLLFVWNLNLSLYWAADEATAPHIAVFI